MKADLVVKTEEIDFLDRVFKDFELSIDEFDHMDDLDSDYLIQEYRCMSEEKRLFGINLFHKMASCDGYVDPRELDIIKMLG